MELEFEKEHFENITTWTLVSGSLGNKSYIIESEGEAFVIDPSRIIEPILNLIQSRKIRVRGVIDTHIHNDYVSGALALAQELNTDYLLPTMVGLDFEAKTYREGEKLEFGSAELSPVESPGHTWEHHSFVLSGLNKDSSRNLAAFTGGSWLAGGAGRTDLVDPSVSAKLAVRQWESIHQLSEMLSPETRIMPTHGRGSYCLESDVAPVEAPTVSSELKVNPVLRLSLDEWAESVGTSSRPIPAYFPMMAPTNRKGPKRFSPRLPDQTDFEELLLRARENSSIVVDIRDSNSALARPIPGALRLNSSAPVFATWFGWMVPPGKPVYVASDKPQRVLEAMENLAQIGREEIEGFSIVPESWESDVKIKVRTALPVDIAPSSERSRTIVDLRHPNERKTGHIKGSIGIPLETLGLASLKSEDFPVLLHCSGGFRAAAATALLEEMASKESVEVLLGEFSLESAGSENTCHNEACGEFCVERGED